MKKQWMSWMLAAAMVGSLAGAVKPVYAAETEVKVALVVNQPFGDQGSMDDLAAGADRAAADFGVEVAKLESDTATFEDDIRAMCAQGYNLIVTTYPYMTDATITVAQEYPDVNFCAVFQNVNVDDQKVDNIWDVEFHGEQAFYVAGYMAAMASESGMVGIQVGGEEPTPNAEGNGFMYGVKDANAAEGKDVSVEFAYAGGYGDPATAKEKAKAMITDGCDFIQNDSGASNAGVVEAAKEAGIGVAGEITEYWDTYEGFWGIIDINFGEVAYQAIEGTVNGTFPGGEHSIYGLKEGGYSLNWPTYERYAEANPAFAPVVEKAKEVVEQISNGDITVEFNTATPNWSEINQ